MSKCLFIVRHSAAITLSAIAFSQLGYAQEELDHEFGGGGNFVSVDDDGGATGAWDIEFDGNSNISETNFAIWDDTNGVFYEGGDDDDFDGTGSGIELFDPASGLGAVDEATGRSISPFLPVTYSGGQYGIEQYTFAEDSGKYIIIQLTVTNNSASPRRTKLLFANDFDMSGPISGDNLGFEAGQNMVWQQDTGAPFATGGSALIQGNFEDYVLGDCCEYTDPEEGDTAEDFVTGVATGNQVTGNDREVASMADLGTLAPGQSACTVWVYGQTVGSDSAEGVSNLISEVQAARVLYATIPSAFSCASGSSTAPAVSVPVAPLWLLGLMAGLLSLVGVRQLRKT
jgi:hypothetical protein